MRYFTAQLWSDINSSDKELARKAEQQWFRNTKSYDKCLAKILPSLNKTNQRFFDKLSLHDGSPILFSIGDLSSNWTTQAKTNIAEIKVMHPDHKVNHIYVLRYSGIQNFTIDFPRKIQLFREKPCVFGNWGYDELSVTKDKLLKHDILFDSGATVTIEFKHFSYKIKRFKSQKDMVRIAEKIASRSIR
jgi:hypothetical protein